MPDHSLVIPNVVTIPFQIDLFPDKTDPAVFVHCWTIPIAGGSIFGVSIYFNEHSKELKEELNKLFGNEFRGKENI